MHAQLTRAGCLCREHCWTHVSAFSNFQEVQIQRAGRSISEMLNTPLLSFVRRISELVFLQPMWFYFKLHACVFFHVLQQEHYLICSTCFVSGGRPEGSKTQSEISERHVATSTHFALFIIFIEHQFKKVLKQNFVLFLLNYDHALHIQQLKREKYEYPSSNRALGLPPLQVPSCPRLNSNLTHLSLERKNKEKT